jgi:hypothetical protein
MRPGIYSCSSRERKSLMLTCVLLRKKWTVSGHHLGEICAKFGIVVLSPLLQFASMNSFWILKCTSEVHSPRMRVWWNISEPGSRVRLVRVWAPCVQNIFEVASSSDYHVDHYVIIWKLLNRIFNIRTEPKSPYCRSRWTNRVFFFRKVAYTRYVTYPQWCFGRNLLIFHQHRTTCKLPVV